MGRNITSNNLTISNTHKHGSTETTMTVVQSAHHGRRMEVLENCYIQFFQYNNMIVNKELQKRNWSPCWTDLISTATIRMRLRLSQVLCPPSQLPTAHTLVLDDRRYGTRLYVRNNCVITMTTVVPRAQLFVYWFCYARGYAALLQSVINYIQQRNNINTPNFTYF